MAESDQNPSDVSPEPVRRIFEVILNRSSGTLKELWHDGLPGELERVFADAGVTAMIRPAAPPDLEKSIVAACERKPDAVIIGGGDGTVSSAARLLVGGEIPLGVLPFGTFNLAARDLGMPLEAMDAARALAAAEVVEIDVLEVADRICLCTAVIGFYPALAKREDEFHGQAWWRKSIRIVRQTLAAWRRSPPLDLEIELEEGGTLKRITRFAAFVPGEYEDVFSVIPKRLSLTGGRLTLYLSRHRSLWALARGALAYLFGMLEVERDIERISTRGVSLRARRRRDLLVMIDGEVVRLSLPLELRLRPGALKVLKGERGGE